MHKHHDKKCSGRPSVITDDLIDIVNEKICENRLTVSQLSDLFPNVSWSVIYDVTERLDYTKLFARWMPKMLTDAQKINIFL